MDGNMYIILQIPSGSQSTEVSSYVMSVAVCTGAWDDTCRTSARSVPRTGRLCRERSAVRVCECVSVCVFVLEDRL